MPALDLADLHTIADRAAFDFGRIIDLADDDGFIGAGADLSTATLLSAYRSGVFPWFGADDPICWWSPSPRCVIDPTTFSPAKSLIRTAKKPWYISVNHAFSDVIEACSNPRAYADSTWIHDEMKDAYTALHKMGAAVSIEVWAEQVGGALIGGLYGVNIGAMYFGESMFHRERDASKIAFWALMRLAKMRGITLIDCQLENPHLMSLGADLMAKDEFIHKLERLSHTPADGLGGFYGQYQLTELLMD